MRRTRTGDGGAIQYRYGTQMILRWLRSFARIKARFAKLHRIRPSLGYCPDPEKSFLVTSAANAELDTEHFRDEGLKKRTGFSYLGGFGGSRWRRYLLYQGRSGKLGQISGNILADSGEAAKGCLCGAHSFVTA